MLGTRLKLCVGSFLDDVWVVDSIVSVWARLTVAAPIGTLIVIPMIVASVTRDVEVGLVMTIHDVFSDPIETVVALDFVQV